MPTKLDIKMQLNCSQVVKINKFYIRYLVYYLGDINKCQI